jgi:cobalt/nickel transport system permease protein
MPGPIDLLPEVDSPLSRLDPRWKLAGILLAVIGVIALRQPATAALALAGAVLLAWLGRLPRRWCLARLGTVGIMVAPFLLLLPFLPAGDVPVWAIGPVAVSLRGASAALVLALKTTCIVLLVLVLLATAPLSDTLKAAQSLRLPGLFIQLAMLTYRYIFVLAGELNRLRTAVRVRGYRNRANLHSYRTVGNLAGTLLVRGYEQAERVGQAMRCRGFDGRFRSLHAFRTRAVDVAAFLAMAGAVVLLLLFDWQIG